ncbi:MAG: ABC transporter ATP-binding protein [Alphaproteobacteria bacterium]|nr:ABC transporter ATP-binding protein [Alphaproteobacteria bacterium]
MAEITLDRVSVDFPVYSGGGSGRSLKRFAMRRATGGRFGRGITDRVVVHALADVTLAFRHGDRVGLVGRNGAGKTTLLRVIAGVYEPTRGTIVRAGHVAPLFDPTLGMDLDATGFENIVLRGLLLDIPIADIKARMDEIAAFTELGDHLSLPVRTYSSGMTLRLAFAVSTCFDPEILVMDEWIGVGDAHFIEKAERRLESFIGRSSVLVVASHSEPLLRRLCNKAVLLDAGRVAAFGPVAEIFAAYNAAAAE